MTIFHSYVKLPEGKFCAMRASRPWNVPWNGATLCFCCHRARAWSRGTRGSSRFLRFRCWNWWDLEISAWPIYVGKLKGIVMENIGMRRDLFIWENTWYLILHRNCWGGLWRIKQPLCKCKTAKGTANHVSCWGHLESDGHGSAQTLNLHDRLGGTAME